MQCTSPISGYRAVEGGGVVSSTSKGYSDVRVTVRCGQCIGCRLERARLWAIRSVHEASLYDSNIFTTQTYSDEQLPYGGTLVRKHFQDFMKRLKRKAPRTRVFYCGEYGDETDRPHYHALLFNYRPDDLELISRKDGHDVWRSDKLDAIWSHGHVNFSDVTFSSAAYVAGYVTKKITGEAQEEHYRWIDPETGEIIDRVPPFQGQSLKPGIGEPWIRKWHKDVYSKDQIVIDGKPMRPPRYYDEWLKKHSPATYKRVMRKRREELPKWTTEEFETKDGKTITAPRLDVDPDAYKGSSRQLYAANRIAKSRQRKRNETDGFN